MGNTEHKMWSILSELNAVVLKLIVERSGAVHGRNLLSVMKELQVSLNWAKPC